MHFVDANKTYSFSGGFFAQKLRCGAYVSLDAKVQSVAQGKIKDMILSVELRDLVPP